MNSRDRRTPENPMPESPSKRSFIKKAAIGIALLPYVAPVIQTLALSSDAYAKKKTISPLSGGKDD